MGLVPFGNRRMNRTKQQGTRNGKPRQRGNYQRGDTDTAVGTRGGRTAPSPYGDPQHGTYRMYDDRGAQDRQPRGTERRSR